ncbi:MAG: DUF5915 domain-containing protein, partial [Mycobacteriaceae bacterium]
WYVRRSRPRFWAADTDAVDTLHTVLEVVCRLAAPLLPLITEVIWRGLTGERSVHLADWPTAAELPADTELVAAMDEVRVVCSTVLGLRKAEKLRVRLPLALLTVAAADAERLRPYVEIIADEVNVKAVDLSTDVAVHGRFELVVNARAAGPRIGKDVQQVIKAVKAGQWAPQPDGTVLAGGVTLIPGEFTERLVAVEPRSTAALPGGEGLVVLDTELSEELEAEGWAKDRIRELQDARRAADFDVSDRIRVVLAVPASRREWAQRHRELIAGEVLAVELTLDGELADGVELGDGVRAALVRVGGRPLE